MREWLGEKGRRLLGRIFARKDGSGHTFLCRFVDFICHYGPRGTFAHLAHIKLDAGGYLCAFGVSCGEPSESHMEQMHERLEWFERTVAALERNGALMTMVWENPRFSSANLCDCGQSDNVRLPDHAPLCPYRVEHDFPVSVEEYKEAINGYSN